MFIQKKNFTIREVGIAEIDEIFEVYKNCEDFLSLGPVSKASKQMVLDDFKISQEEGGIFCGIYIQNKMVGVIDFVLSNFDGNPCHAYLSLLMISAFYRRQGLGMDVVKAVEEEILKNKSIKSILAGVQTNNQPAIAFWTAMGYKIVSEPRLMPDTTIAFKLQKDIN